MEVSTNKNKDSIDSLVTEEKQPLNNTYVPMPRPSSEWTSYSIVQKKKKERKKERSNIQLYVFENPWLFPDKYEILDQLN